MDKLAAKKKRSIRTGKAPARPKATAAAPGGLPDRAHMLTEQRNPRTQKLHAMSVIECVRAINEQDAGVAAALRRAGPALAGFIAALETRFLDERAPGRLIYIGAGTSGRLGVLDASEIPPTFQISPGRVIGIIAGGDRALRKSSEGKEDDPAGAAAALRKIGLNPRDTVLGIAAGGTTPYVQGGLAMAKRIAPGCLTGLLSCSPLAKPAAADHLIVLETGPEVLTGSTRMKAGTATKLALNTITTTLMARSGRVYQNLMVDMRASNAKLRDRAARIISTLTGLERGAALVLLDRANGAVKTAVVMHAMRCDRRRAEKSLAQAGGRLDRVIGE